MSNFTESNGTTAVSPYGTRRSLPFKRSQFVIDAAGVRQQNNSVTGFLDASVVYGTSAGAWADAAVCQRLFLRLPLLCARFRKAQKHTFLACMAAARITVCQLQFAKLPPGGVEWCGIDSLLSHFLLIAASCRRGAPVAYWQWRAAA